MLTSLLLLLPALPFQEPDRLDERLALLAERIEDARVDAHVPGVGFALVNREGVLWSGGFGLADLHGGRPADERTLFAIGSTTKAFTSTLVGDLVDDGLLGWDDPATEVVPGWSLAGRDGEVITVRDLLSHRTGYPRMSLLFISGKVGPERILEVAGGAKPWRDYHQAFLYSNIQYMAAGLAAAEAGGASWESLLETRLLDPLGMVSTTGSFPRVVGDVRRAIGYRWDRHGEKHIAMPPRDISNVGPAGSLYSNARDMSHWLQFQLNHGSWQGEQLVSAESIDQTWSSNIEIGGGVDYGMGWMLHDYNGQPWVEHGGNIDGYSAKVGMLPESGYGFVMLSNLNGAPLQAQIDPIVWECLLGPLPGDEAEGGAEQDLSPYLGKYLADFPPFNGRALEAIEQDGKLAVVVPDQGTFALKPPDEDGYWAWELTDAIRMSFSRAEDGSVFAMLLNQGPASLEMLREGYEVPIEIPLAELQPMLGVYHLAEANMNWTVQIQNNRLAIDVPGELVYELYPPDEEGWRVFRAVSELKARFPVEEDGTIQRLEFQRGETAVELPRVGEAPAALPRAAQVLEELGTAARLAAFRAAGGIRLELDIAVEQAGLSGTATASGDGQGRFLSTVDFGEFGSGRSVLRSDGGWTMSDFEPFREWTPNEAAQSFEMSGFLVQAQPLDAFYDSLRVRSRSTWRDVEFWVLLGEREGRPPTELWFEIATGDLRRVLTNIDLDGAGYLPVEVRLGKYAEASGLRLPHQIEITNEATGRTTQTLQKVQIGAGPTDADLAPPRRGED